MGPEVHYAILRTLSYFQVFRYPLTKEEIWKHLSLKCTQQELEAGLSQLHTAGTIFFINNYYCLYNDTTLVIRRKEGNALGEIKLKKAIHISRFLGLFPFVEAVFISGSLSKDFATKDSDLDYFVITSANRLWIARNFMHLFRKLTFIVNAQDSFCMNYFVSMHHLKISPENLYTAIELATLKTTYAHIGNELIKANEHWIATYLPNACFNNKFSGIAGKRPFLKKTIESLINKLGGDKIEMLFYKTTMKRWAKKWSRQNYDIEKCMLSTGLHFNTPMNYPKHIPDMILQHHEALYNESVARYNNAIEPIGAKA